MSKGFVAVVDDADAAKVNQFVWTAMVVGAKVYACRRIKIDGRRQWVLLHRWLIDAPAGFDVDHIDGDSLNNRRANLRVATRSQNTANSRFIQGAVPFRGVSREGDKFRADITYQGITRRLGRFATAEAASAVYDAERLRLFGEFVPA